MSFLVVVPLFMMRSSVDRGAGQALLFRSVRWFRVSGHLQPGPRSSGWMDGPQLGGLVGLGCSFVFSVPAEEMPSYQTEMGLWMGSAPVGYRGLG